MSRNRSGLGFTGTTGLFDRSKGGSALRTGLSSGLDTATPDLTNLNATGGEGTGSSHEGLQLGSDNGDPLAFALTRKGLDILRDTPTSIYKTPQEEEQYYQDSIRRLREATDLSYKQAAERAQASGLIHSGALVGEYGDIGERLVTASGEQLRALKKEDRAFADSSLVARAGLVGGLQSQFAGQKIATAGLALQAKNDALTRAIAQGRETGQFIDPETGEVHDTQASL